MTTPADIFSHLSENVDMSKLEGVTAKVVFDLSGDNGGAWTLTINDGSAEVSEGADPEAEATIKMSDQDYVAMTNGDLNPMMAFMSGKIKVEGDMSTVMKLQSIL